MDALFQRTFTEAELEAIGARLAVVFKLKRSPTNKTRWDVLNGDKTNLGLARVFLRVAQEIEDGTPAEQLYS